MPWLRGAAAKRSSDLCLAYDPGDIRTNLGSSFLPCLSVQRTRKKAGIVTRWWLRIVLLCVRRSWPAWRVRCWPRASVLSHPWRLQPKRLQPKIKIRRIRVWRRQGLHGRTQIVWRPTSQQSLRCKTSGRLDGVIAVIQSPLARKLTGSDVYIKYIGSGT